MQAKKLLNDLTTSTRLDCSPRMPTGGTHWFSVPAVCYPSASVFFPTSCFESLSVPPALSVKSSFTAFVSNYYTSKGDVKLWNKPCFSVPCLLCHDAPMGDWFFCACGRARPSSTGFPSIPVSPSTSPAYASLHRSITTTTSSSSILSSVLSCKNRFSVLSEESLCDDPLNLEFDDIPVAPRPKRHCISAAGISPILPESANKPDFPYQPCTEKLDLGSNQLLVKLLFPYVRKPTRGSESAAGYDLYASEETIIPPKSRKMVDTGIAIAMNTPENLNARIAPRSGLSVEGLDIGASVIDADYRGFVKILLINHSDITFQVKIGDQIAQLILEHIENPVCTTCRNQGFGSTALSANSADLGCGNPMVIPVAIKKEQNNIPWKSASAMIDSRASTQFVDPEFAQGFGLQLDLKSVPESLIVVNGRRAAPLTHTCTLDLLIDQHLETLTFQVTK